VSARKLSESLRATGCMAVAIHEPNYTNASAGTGTQFRCRRQPPDTAQAPLRMTARGTLQGRYGAVFGNLAK
jgi:hypothetical protein